jgi:hypothetical protein
MPYEVVTKAGGFSLLLPDQLVRYSRRGISIALSIEARSRLFLSIADERALPFFEHIIFCVSF